MWMAAGFAMLEAGLVRAKNTTEILTKNVALFAIACIMYMSAATRSCTAASSSSSAIDGAGMDAHR
jgi:Amt family ammonium transporter